MSLTAKKASIVFYVSDIARTERFYTDVLGLSIERMEGAEPYWLQARLEGGPEILFFQMDGVRGDTTSLPGSSTRASPS